MVNTAIIIKRVLSCECDVNTDKFTSAKQEDLCRRGSKSKTGLAFTQTSAVSERVIKTGHHPLLNKLKFIDQDSHWCACKVKGATLTRLLPQSSGHIERLTITHFISKVR